MVDEHTRLLERRWKETGDISDFSRYAGALSRATGKWNRHKDYPHLAFGLGSTVRMTPIDAWDYARKKGGILQSLAEAVIRRMILSRQSPDGSDLYQITRTVNLKFSDGLELYSAFAELPDDESSRELLTEGFNMPVREGIGGLQELLIPKSEKLVARLLNHARIQRARDSFECGTSEYGSDDYVIALFGDVETAQRYGGYLHRYGTGNIWDMDRDKISQELANRKDCVLVRPVGLGGRNYFGISHIIANDMFCCSAYACPVISADKR